MATIDDFIHEPRVAYFSMEIALRNEIPTYAGGLGVLAGDTLRSAADLEIPLVAVTLASTAGYFRQMIDAEGRQTEQTDPWEPSQWAVSLDAIVAVTIEGRRVWIGGWLYVLGGHMNGTQPVVLLDTDLEQNGADDRAITRQLYGGDEAYRLRQEVVLGIGGIRMLQALGFQLRQYHMNEGHSALLALELLRRYAHPTEEVRAGESPYDIPRVRELCCFTTHTPVEAGHDKFGYDLVQRVLGDYIDPLTLRHLAGAEDLNMTRLALNLSEYVNGVARRHAEVSRHMFPGYHVHAVTNGVHPFTWTSVPFRKLFDARLPGWCHEPELLMRAECCIPDESVLMAHEEAKQRLIDEVNTRSGISLSVDCFTLGFARRMTAYKRPDLLFSDLERLQEIARRHPIQIVLAGKAHPKDASGKQLIETLHNHIRELGSVIPVAYLPDYDMATALALVSGVDVWLNTPLRPMEASGTSGMKAAFNGVPHVSVLDGWWIEGCIEGITGWAIGDDASSANGNDAGHLYQKLEQTILPLYYEDRAGWTAIMKGAIAKCASYFNSQRMMRRYASEAYVR
ncbi:alpha-glucan phosphorylase [Candidatus Tenderia electrophaga]|jgi:starch phosphorylase|uniref:Alpha-glucan phosphorylase n=1 Tax=Candidatus Tenderia electrophaga TaxID=1748243 RepID=A0A0S2TF95_9GAMM|nr:alpha-glucan phosphorylase [Candidatus Tenderia electrophaga]